MGFLPNDGDIILDAVLTDTGRARLARGDNSFQITKFALADDEIDYGKYNKNDASGSAFYDVDILTTPVLESFTDNAASMKSKLLSIPRDNLLYLPILKLNTVIDGAAAFHSNGNYVIAVDKLTENKFNPSSQGIMFGENPSGKGAYIKVDQGLDTNDISPSRPLDSNLVETQYIVQIDNRLGSIVSRANARQAQPSYIDDDNIASYFFTLGTDRQYVKEIDSTQTDDGQVIAGPRGTTFETKVLSSLELNSGTALFEELGTTSTMTDKDGNSFNIYKIDSFINVMGATTGYRLSVPVRFIRQYT